jgi:hypothetical protein
MILENVYYMLLGLILISPLLILIIGVYKILFSLIS